MENIVILLGFGLLMYVMVIRPQKKKQAEHTQLMATLTSGTDVITIGGIYGTVVDVAEATVDLEVTDDGVVLRFAKSAIASIARADIEPDDAEIGDDGTAFTAEDRDEA